MAIKILFLTHKFYPDIGGIEINSEILANYFTSEGHKVCLATWSIDKNHQLFPFKIIRNPGIRQLFKIHKWADVVFENNPCIRLSWPNILFNRPAVVALNTWVQRLNGKLGIQDQLKIILLKRAFKVIAVSEALRKKSWDAAVVIGNPFKNDLFKIINNINRQIDFVFLGRLVSDKGVSLAIEAMKYLPHSKLTIIGDGPELSKLKLLAISLRLDTRVNFTGNLSGNELANCLNKHKYILVPSIWDEPFGNVVLEGMACGCLPIASNCGGLPDAVGNAGVLFKRGDIKSLVEVINKLFNNPSYELKLRHNAAEHLMAHRPDVVAQQYLEIIKEAVFKYKI